jgi:iron(III) transport system permease protein
VNRAYQFLAVTVLWIGLALVCGVPLAYATAGVLDVDLWRAFDGRSARLLLNSVLLAGGSAVVACLIGAPVGFALGGLRTRSERLLACAAAVPFLIPTYVAAIAWIEIAGTHGVAAQALGNSHGWIYSPLGAAWVLGAAHLTVPAAAVVLAAYSGALSGVGPARHARDGWAVFRRIVLPAVWPYLVAAGALVFLFNLAEFAVPSLLQLSVFPAEIHTQFVVDYDPGPALATSAPVVGVGLLVLIATALYLRRAAPPLGQRVHVDVSGLPSGCQRTFSIAAWIVLLVTAGFPVLALVRRAESLQSLRDAWATAGPEWTATVSVGAATSTACVVVAFLVVHGTMRASLRTAAAFVASLTLLLPGSAIAITLIEAWNRPGIRGAVYDGPAIVVLACAARWLAVAVVVLAVVRVSRAREWTDAARVFGVPSWRRIVAIALPAAAPALILAWAAVFVLSARESEASALVAPPGFTTLAVRLLALTHSGPNTVVAGLSLLLVSVTIGIAALLAGIVWGTLRWVYGAPVRS